MGLIKTLFVVGSLLLATNHALATEEDMREFVFQIVDYTDNTAAKKRALYDDLCAELLKKGFATMSKTELRASFTSRAANSLGQILKLKSVVSFLTETGQGPTEKTRGR